MPEFRSLSLWKYRAFIFGSVEREFKERYRNSVLGAFWTLLGPMANILIYTVIFSEVMKAKLPGIERTYAYGIYLCSGVIFWSFFSEIVSKSQNIFLDHADLIKKLNFPKICLPIIVNLNAMVNFAIFTCLFWIFLLLTGSFPFRGVLALPLVVAIGTLMATGLGVMLGVLNVFFRDVAQGFSIILQFWFWFTPIVYPIGILSPEMKKILSYNPMTPLINATQEIYVYGGITEFSNLLFPLATSCVFLVAGMYIYRRHAYEIADEI